MRGNNRQEPKAKKKEKKKEKKREVGRAITNSNRHGGNKRKEKKRKQDEKSKGWRRNDIRWKGGRSIKRRETHPTHTRNRDTAFLYFRVADEALSP